MIHDKKIKKIIPKRNKDALHIFLKEKRGIKPENGKTWIAHWKNEFDELCDLKKEEYKNKAIKDKERYEKEIRNFKNMVFDIPKKPLSCYTILVTKKIPELKKKNPNAKITDLIKEIAQDYQKKKAEYESKYERAEREHWENKGIIGKILWKIKAAIRKLTDKLHSMINR